MGRERKSKNPLDAAIALAKQTLKALSDLKEKLETERLLHKTMGRHDRSKDMFNLLHEDLYDTGRIRGKRKKKKRGKSKFDS